MVNGIWINGKGQENHVYLYDLYHKWSIYGYNIVNMTRKLVLDFMHKF